MDERTVKQHKIDNLIGRLNKSITHPSESRGPADRSCDQSFRRPETNDCTRVDLPLGSPARSLRPALPKPTARAEVVQDGRDLPAVETALERNHRLRAQLGALVAWRSDYAKQVDIDVVITTNEINDRHGTGVLVKRILQGRPNLFSIRFQDDWGDHDFGDWNIRLPKAGLNRSESFRNVLRLLHGHRVRQVLCVPFLVEELMTSIAIQGVFGARLCGYVMDDQNVATDRIPDALMREFLEKCSLRLATHPELRIAYEHKYGMPFFVLPAVAPDALIPKNVLQPVLDLGRGALLGSFWDQSWFDRLCAALEPSGRQIDWFGNHRSPFVEFSQENLMRARIHPFGVISEERLAVELRGYPFIIVPTGSFDAAETNHSVASLSLPGRIPFAAAVSQTPILVVGSPKTCAARFVKHFGIGETVPYDGVKIRAAMDRLSDGRIQSEMRSNAGRIGPAFSDRGIRDWLEASIREGCPADARFEQIFAGYS
jgi:hypothetical protein